MIRPLGFVCTLVALFGLLGASLASAKSDSLIGSPFGRIHGTQTGRAPTGYTRSATDVLPASVHATTLAVSTACADQCNLDYSTCIYMALAGRNSCMTRCSMTLYPKKCYPSCKSFYNQAMQDCAAANRDCFAACP